MNCPYPILPQLATLAFLAKVSNDLQPMPDLHFPGDGPSSGKLMYQGVRSKHSKPFKQG
jgi:hypothetical protein